MPLFSYHCSECGADFELLLARFDSPAECPKCGHPAPDRLPSRIGAIAVGHACAARHSCPAAGSGCCGGHCNGHHGA